MELEKSRISVAVLGVEKRAGVMNFFLVGPRQVHRTMCRYH